MAKPHYFSYKLFVHILDKVVSSRPSIDRGMLFDIYFSPMFKNLNTIDPSGTQTIADIVRRIVKPDAHNAADRLLSRSRKDKSVSVETTSLMIAMRDYLTNDRCSLSKEHFSHFQEAVLSVCKGERKPNGLTEFEISGIIEQLMGNEDDLGITNEEMKILRSLSAVDQITWLVILMLFPVLDGKKNYASDISYLLLANGNEYDNRLQQIAEGIGCSKFDLRSIINGFIDAPDGIYPSLPVNDELLLELLYMLVTAQYSAAIINTMLFDDVIRACRKGIAFAESLPDMKTNLYPYVLMLHLRQSDAHWQLKQIGEQLTMLQKADNFEQQYGIFVDAKYFGKIDGVNPAALLRQKQGLYYSYTRQLEKCIQCYRNALLAFSNTDSSEYYLMSRSYTEVDLAVAYKKMMNLDLSTAWYRKALADRECVRNTQPGKIALVLCGIGLNHITSEDFTEGDALTNESYQIRSSLLVKDSGYRFGVIYCIYGIVLSAILKRTIGNLPDEKWNQATEMLTYSSRVFAEETNVVERERYRNLQERNMIQTAAINFMNRADALAISLFELVENSKVQKYGTAIFSTSTPLPPEYRDDFSNLIDARIGRIHVLLRDTATKEKAHTLLTELLHFLEIQINDTECGMSYQYTAASAVYGLYSIQYPESRQDAFPYLQKAEKILQKFTSYGPMTAAAFRHTLRFAEYCIAMFTGDTAKEAELAKDPDVLHCLHDGRLMGDILI